MAKTYNWEIEEKIFNEENGEPTGETRMHNVTLKASRLTGKAIVTIDGREFDISEKPFSLGGVEQVFRLGDMAALLRFSKKGVPSIIVHNQTLEAK